MRADVSCVNVAAVAAAAATGGVVDAARDDHVWMVCQGDGGPCSEPVLDNDIKVRLVVVMRDDSRIAACTFFEYLQVTCPQSFVATIITVFELASPPVSRAQQNSISAVLSKCRCCVRASVVPVRVLRSCACVCVRLCVCLSARVRIFACEYFSCVRLSHEMRYRAQEQAPEASPAVPVDDAAVPAVPAAAVVVAAAAIPSPALNKRPREDEPAVGAGGAGGAGGGGGGRQRWEGGGGDWVRVHRVGTSGDV